MVFRTSNLLQRIIGPIAYGLFSRYIDEIMHIQLSSLATAGNVRPTTLAEITGQNEIIIGVGNRTIEHLAGDGLQRK